MKRSEINRHIREFEEKIREHRFELPPFLSFTPEEWKEKGHEYDEIRDNALGWDITDYGEGHFDTKGLYLITLRNGNIHNSKYRKPYAEKIMMLKDGQLSPNHFHWNKMEDIINRGGGNVIFRLWNADKNESTGLSLLTHYPMMRPSRPFSGCESRRCWGMSAKPCSNDSIISCLSRGRRPATCTGFDMCKP